MICESTGSRSSTGSQGSSFSSSSEISDSDSDSHDEDFSPPTRTAKVATLDAYASTLAEEVLRLGELEATFELAAADHSVRDRSESPSDVDEQEYSTTYCPTSLTHLLPVSFTDINMQRLFYASLIIWSACTLLRYSLTSEGKLAVRLQPPPAPFFPNASTSYVTDFYSGNGASRRNLASMAEIVVLFYYAPWSLHCMEARRPFQEVASTLREFKMVKFAAVNCFYPHGECRRTYKLYSYPVVVAYVGQGVSVVYTEPISTDRLFNWVRHLMQPTDRIQSSQDFTDLFAQHHFAVVGYLPFPVSNEISHEYTIYHSAAMKSTARDALIFATFQSADTAAAYEFTQGNQLRIFKRGEPTDYNFNLSPRSKSSDVLDWVYGFLSQSAAKTVQWLNLEEADDGGKSKTLFKVVNSSSTTLVLFSNNLGLSYKAPLVSHLEDAVERFHDCSDATATSVSSKASTPLSEYLSRSMKYCALMSHSGKADDCCESLSTHGFCEQRETSEKNGNEKEVVLDNGTCKPMLDVFGKDEIIGRCCDRRRKQRQTIRRNRTLKQTSLSATGFLSSHARMDCMFYRLMKRTQPSVLNELLRQAAERNQVLDTDSLKGLSCRTNLTYTFLAIDKRFSQHFRNVWNIAQSANDSLVAISAEEEVINHFNSTDISREAVDNFLLESVHRQLVPVELDESRRRSFFSQQQSGDLPGLSRLETLTTETFYEHLINKTNNLHDSLVFFSGGSAHGPSMSLTYVLHTLKKHFSDFSSLLRFYIVDTSRNSLPWQYRFDALPTLAFFPARRKGQSSILPKELPMTVPKVMAFILSRCQAELRWRIAIASCSDQCVERNRKRLDHLSSAIVKDIRSWETVRPFYAKHGALIDTLLEKRLLQQRASEHLLKLLNVLEQSREHERSLSDEAKDLLVRDSLFVRWILANRFGAMYDTL